MSSTVTTGLKRSFTAGASISQYRAVTIASDGDAEHATDTASILIAGASDRAAASGESVTVALANAGGSAYIEAHEAITKGTLVYATAAGKVAKAATTTNDVLVGTALTAAGTSGDIIEVLFA
jgi:hypothetical protein